MKLNLSPFIFVLILWLCFGFFHSASPALAQSVFNRSSSEDVGLSFYKSSNIKPNFKEWAKKTDAFKYKSVTEADSYIKKESERLQSKWGEIDKKGNVINIYFSSVAIVKPVPKENIDDPAFYDVHILLNKSDKAYFPYKFHDKHFALIPNNIEKVLSFTIDDSNAALILKNLKLESKEPVEIQLSIHPTKAYSKKPELIDGINQWVLMGDIVTMQMTAKKTNTILWNYSEKNYVSPKRAVLNKVYDLKRQELNFDENPLE